MEESKRRRIIQNFVRLVNETRLDALLPKLLESGVFNANMISKYQNVNHSLDERKRNLFLDIQTRGPEAFQKLVTALVHTDHLDLAQALDPSIDVADVAGHHREATGTVPFELPNYLREQGGELSNGVHHLHVPGEQISYNDQPLVVTVKKATHYRDEPSQKNLAIYPMRSKPRGYLLMINNVEFENEVWGTRQGALVDDANLEDLFVQLGYEVFKHRDQSLQDMKRTIQEFSQLEVHKHVDSCVVALMSHGHQWEDFINETSIVASDNLSLPTDWVIKQFDNSHCPNLRGKPKIFIFQNCRGNFLDFGVRMTAGRIQHDGSSTAILRTYSDILICNATVPGYISNRDIFLGTWYIQSLCEIFMNNAHDTDIEDMLKMVDQKLEKLASEFGHKQTSSYENRGFRKLYFNPGL